TLEADSLIANKTFTNAELIDIYCRQTAQLIFPKRKIGEIKENFEANFLALKENPVLNIATLKAGIVKRIRQGKSILVKE
ncbi:MAG: hypothetical protein ACKVOW_07190, partial [Chitinophagaceae bacterium]